MREKRREPEVPEERVPVVECFDGNVRTASKELAPFHSVNCGTSETLFYKTKSGCRFGKSVHMHIGRFGKRSKKNDEKSAVAILKKYELHDRKEQPVVDRDTG